MGKHMDRASKEQEAQVKEIKIEKQKAFKELVERINNLEKAVEALSKNVKVETKENK